MGRTLLILIALLFSALGGNPSGLPSAFADKPSERCNSLLGGTPRAAASAGLEAYGIDPKQVRLSPGGKPVIILGQDEGHFTPPPSNGSKPIRDPEKHDVIVVGVGLAGSVATVYGSDDPNVSVLSLDTQKEPGGLAHSITLLDPATGNPVPIDNGAAYWASPDKDEFKIMQHIGLPDYKRFAIPEDIDTYLLYGKLYPGIWATKTVSQLPKDFALFKFVIRRLDRMGLTPTQPMNKDPDPLGLDKISTADFIRRMPSYVAGWIAQNPRDTAAKNMLSAFIVSEGGKPDPMSNVLALMDNYCRSAHGGPTEKVDAHEFLNFYASELDTRYTGPLGTGELSSRAIQKFSTRKNVELKTSAQVVKLSPRGNETVVTYLRDGQLHETVATSVVYAAPMKLAPKLIEGFAADRPDAVEALGRIKNSDYLVVNVIVDGQIDRKKLPGYDIWLGPPRDREHAPTDVINGTWTIPEQDRPKGMDVLTIYVPLGAEHVGQGFTDSDVLRLTEDAQNYVFDRLREQIVDPRGRKLNPKFAIASRWPFSIPLNGPGHAEVVNILDRPYGNIFFAGLGLDTPSVEASLYYGRKSAIDAVRTLSPQHK